MFNRIGSILRQMATVQNVEVKSRYPMYLLGWLPLLFLAICEGVLIFIRSELHVMCLFY